MASPLKKSTYDMAMPTAMATAIMIFFFIVSPVL
ncbi:MAG: hypothetical protein HGB32_14430 [Geobacteraceae bacterium]|nr:hypothetical protein [Geobacteraceae bacterium]NTW81323.1 hypothetical protein [Geobacteraceae bacterium]